MSTFARLDAPTGILLEAPRWSEGSGLLTWVDIPTGRVFSLNPENDTVTTYETGTKPLGAALPLPSGIWALVGPRGVRQWKPSDVEVRQENDCFVDSERISNDAEFDPWGRLYVGRMSPDGAEGAASLCVVELDGTVRTVTEGLTIPNGMAWSPDRSWMYFAESIERRIYRVPTSETGEDWARREVLIQFEDSLPDGLTIGPDGSLWVACNRSSRVERFSLTGERLGAYSLPVSQVTACEFVGNDLYATSAAEDFTQEDWEREPLAGSLFRLRNASAGHS